jgi:hypothetical protein
MTQGKISSAANGHLSYDIGHAKATFLYEIMREMADKYKFNQSSKLSVGFDEVITDMSLGNVKILLGWDNWSGCYIMADDEEGDKWIPILSEHFNHIIEEEQYKAFMEQDA